MRRERAPLTRLHWDDAKRQLKQEGAAAWSESNKNAVEIVHLEKTHTLFCMTHPEDCACPFTVDLKSDRTYAQGTDERLGNCTKSVLNSSPESTGSLED